MLIGERTITIKRPAAGSYSGGLYTAGVETTLTIKGVIQPLQDREVQMLPEGIRTRARWKLYTRSTLQEYSVNGQTIADRVVLGSVETVVHKTRDFASTAPVFGLTSAERSLEHRRYVLVEPEVV